MEDDLIASLDVMEPPRKKFKHLVQNEQPVTAHGWPCFLKNIPRDILSEVLDYLDTKTIFDFTVTCHYFNESNLWDLVTKLQPSGRYPIRRIVSSLNVSKLTKLENLIVDEADRKGYLSTLTRFTNLVSLKTYNGPSCRFNASLIVDLLAHCSLLRELRTPVEQKLLAHYKGAFLTKLDNSRCTEFDPRFITHFHKLESLVLDRVELTNTHALTQLTRLTALTVKASDNSESDIEYICRLTQLLYLDLGSDAVPIHSLSNLYNLTALKCSRLARGWTKILAPLTALQRIDIPRLATDRFSPQLCSTLTHLFYYRSPNQSHVFELTALQNLDINISPDPAVHDQFSKLKQLTKLRFWLDHGISAESLFWTTLTHLSYLELHRSTDKRLVEMTKQLMPTVQVETSSHNKTLLI
jgi:hypothetical protein